MPARDDTQTPQMTVAGGDRLSDAQIDSFACWLLDLIEGATDATTEADAADIPRPTLPLVCGDEASRMVGGDAAAGTQ